MADTNITLDFKQADEILAMFGGEPGEVTLILGDGHSGRGLYAHYSDYPEEGAEFLGVSDEEAMPVADAANPALQTVKPQAGEVVTGGDAAWQMEMAHRQLDRMGIPRADDECYLSAWGRFSLAFQQIAGLRITIPLNGPARFDPAAPAQAAIDAGEQEAKIPKGWRIAWEPRNVLALRREGTAQPYRFSPGEVVHSLLLDLLGGCPECGGRLEFEEGEAWEGASIGCIACGTALASRDAAPAPAAAGGYEHYAAIREGHRNAAEAAWFSAIPNIEPRRAFQAGFDAGYNSRDAALAQPAPVQPSDEEMGALMFKLECFIDHATGGKLSKSSWALETLKAAADEHLRACVDEALREAAPVQQEAAVKFTCEACSDSGVVVDTRGVSWPCYKHCAAVSAPAQQETAAESLDVCTDSDNCTRCKTASKHRGDLYHAGIPVGRSFGAKPREEKEAPLRDRLVDLLATHLSGTYHCTRVWSAWHVGTMSEDDFEDVGESDTPTEIADAILAALTPPAVAAPAQAGETK
ncbi:hypothetical protein [Variovorax sp. DAIF25]|uniref:hypothetical protein n=1 Tax=Variovorax sp. DAIF25 TaxID=3080983 RepID=UPI003D6C28B6